MRSGRSTAFLPLFEIFTGAIYREVHHVERAGIPGGPPCSYLDTQQYREVHLDGLSGKAGRFTSTGKST